MLILVTGGARSGKSTFAESLLLPLEGDKLYIATAIPIDEEMKERIQKHQSVRPQNWETYEGYKNLDQMMDEKGQNYGGILLDCVTLWLMNLLYDFSTGREMEEFNQTEINQIEKRIAEEINRFIQEVKKIPGTVILVTNEIGMGIVPENLLSRIFRDLQGRINQLLGKAADSIYLVVCGVPMEIKQNQHSKKGEKNENRC